MTAFALVFIMPGCLVDKLGGAFEHEPDELREGLSPDAKALIARASEEVDPKRRFDYHTHIIGSGDSGSGCYINQHMLTWAHPYARFRFLVYASASGVKNLEKGLDRQYMDRLVRLVRNIDGHGRHLVLGLDQYHTRDGRPDPNRTEYYVPNPYAAEIAQRHPDLFLSAVSIHPYRSDALEALTKWAKKGARVVKWIPNAMGIDPSDKRCGHFYDIMRQHQMILLTHTGDEKAIEAEGDQKYGSPLLLRKALDKGVKVIMAHAASLGENADLDSPQGEPVHNFNLFMRLMDDKRYEGLLFADISATLQYNRVDRVLETLLKRADLHHRLVNGSDYPLPAVNVLIRLGKLEKVGLITEQERAWLKEIYHYNPLLFDFVLKRTVKLRGAKQGFPPSVFMLNNALAPLSDEILI